MITYRILEMWGRRSVCATKYMRGVDYSLLLAFSLRELQTESVWNYEDFESVAGPLLVRLEEDFDSDWNPVRVIRTVELHEVPSWLREHTETFFVEAEIV